MRRFFYSVGIALLCQFLAFPAAISQTTFNNASGDNQWLNAANWSNGLPADGNNPTIPAGFVALLNPTSDYIFDFDVTNEGSITINLVNSNVNNGGFPARTFTNNGAVVINGGGTGIFTNLNTFNNNGTGSVINNGTFINNGVGLINNEGNIDNNDFLQHSGNIVSNGGTLTNAECATFRAENNSTGSLTPDFINNGITYIIGNASLLVTQNNGAVLTDPNATPQPTAVCISTPLEISLDANGMVNITVDDIDDGSSADYCSITNRFLTQTNFTCADIGSNMETLTVQDGNGAQATCTATVIVNDTANPTVNCPADIAATTTSGDCGAIVNFTMPTGDDNCGIASVTQTDNTGLTNGDEFPIGTTTLTIEVADVAGNTADCSFDITITEFDPGTTALFCDQSVNISLGYDCSATLTPAAALEGNYGCYDNFTVLIEETGTDMVGMDELGQTVTIEVTNNISGNSCWGFGLVEEKLAPQLVTACEDTVLTCLQNPAPISEGGEVSEPEFDDCSSFSVSYTQTETTGGCGDPFTREIIRTFVAVDAGGETNQCSQTITVEPLSLTDGTVECPATFQFECVNGDTPNFDPSITGYPTFDLNGTVYDLNPDFTMACSFGVTFSDGQPTDKCGIGYSILRTWTVMDWCLPVGQGNPFQCFQQLKYVDTTPPVATPPAAITLNTNNTTCFSNGNIPPINANDCSDFEVVIATPIGAINGNGGNIPATGLAPGDYTIIYIITDDCGNTTQVPTPVTVQDNTAPQMFCNTFTTVSLDNSGVAIAPAEVFDDNSFDNCCIDTYSVRRMNNNCDAADDLDYGPTVTFCCADVGTNQMVEMRIEDCNGNSNSCMVEVEVQDKNDPTITCPANITIECEQDPNDLSIVGTVVLDPANQTNIDGLASNVCEVPTLDIGETGSLNCGVGTLTRTFTATSSSGVSVSCFHHITVVNSNPFDVNDIMWPDDATFPSCTDVPSPAVTGEPTIMVPNMCADVVIGFTDMTFDPINGNFCKKTERTWIVTDMCQFDPNIPNSSGRFTYVQTIILEDNESPVLSGCQDVSVCNFKADCSEVGVVLSINVTDNCTDPADIDLEWVVDFFNDGVADSGPNSSGTGMNDVNSYPNGTHRITYEATDHCGNTTECSYLFTITDCKKPTPFCVSSNTTIMQGGSIALPINQFIDPLSNDNCTAFEDLIFSFSADVNDQVANLDCDDVGEVDLQIWATDEAGNQDFCVVTIDLQDNSDACSQQPLMANISGQVATAEALGVAEVMVEITGGNYFMDYTNTAGAYMAEDIPTNANYQIVPQLDENPLNGVTVFDLVKIKKHILNTQLLDSPYKLIAADANNNQQVTTADIVHIKKLILQQIPTFANNTSWRFVDASYTFPDPVNPWSEAFPETYTINNLDSDMGNGDFVAIKIGDVTGNAIVNNLMTADDRSKKTLFVQTANQSYERGNRVEVTLNLADFNTIQAYQFTLNFDTDLLEFVAVEGSVLSTESDFGYAFINEGMLTTAWTREAHLETPTNDLFTVVFQAKGSGDVAQALQINSRKTIAVAYAADKAEQLVALNFEGTDAPVRPVLYQNTPNPFEENTTIGFYLPESTRATLLVTDATGKVWMQHTADYTAGYHEHELTRDQIGQSGVLYYQLSTPAYTETKKMLRK